MRIELRHATTDDLSVLHAINEASTPGVGTLSPDALAGLQREGALTLVAHSAGGIEGFVLCLVEGASYESPNFAWISERYPTFAYVDRVAVVPERRNNGLGRQLYEAVFAHFAPVRPVLLAEVNLRPENPGSLRFHRRMGFAEVGERWSGDGSKGVVYVERRLR